MEKSPEAFIGKLGCRLAFERTGVRLYDALIVKASIVPASESVISLDTLWKFRNEELQHFRLVESAMRSIGANPTAQTPSANVDVMASLGLMQVLTDPRTSLSHCLDAILIAELADNDAWQLLIQLAVKMGMDNLARGFSVACRTKTCIWRKYGSGLKNLCWKTRPLPPNYLTEERENRLSQRHIRPSFGPAFEAGGHSPLTELTLLRRSSLVPAESVTIVGAKQVLTGQALVGAHHV